MLALFVAEPAQAVIRALLFAGAMGLVGAVLFVGAAVGKVSIEKTVKALLPFYAVLFLVLIAVTYIPALSLWLPSVVL